MLVIMILFSPNTYILLNWFVRLQSIISGDTCTNNFLFGILLFFQYFTLNRVSSDCTTRVIIRHSWNPLLNRGRRLSKGLYALRSQWSDGQARRRVPAVEAWRGKSITIAWLLSLEPVLVVMKFLP